MGKSSRTARIKEKRKVDPLGGVRHLDIGQHSALRESKILPVVKNISSLDASERVQAVTAIANLVEDPTCRKLLLKERVVITLMEKTLNDSSPEVVVRGWGALRNLAVEEGYDVCLHMYRKDILTPLTAAIPKIQTTIKSLVTDPASVDNVTKKLVWIYTENVIGLLAALSGQATGEVVSAVSKLDISPLLMGLLSPEYQAPRVVQDTAAQCLNIITEEQDELIRSIIESDNGYVSLLLNLRDSPVSSLADALLRTVAICGVAHNISDFLSISGNTNNPFSDSINLTRLSAVIQLACKLSRQTNGRTAEPGEDIIGHECIEAVKDGLETLTSIIASLQDQINGEISGSVALPDDLMDEDSEEEEEDTDEGKEFDQPRDEDEVLEDIATVNAFDRDPQEGASEPTKSLTTHLIETIIPLLLPLCTTQDKSSPTAQAIQLRAINCLNNVSWISTTAIPRNSSLFQTFQKHAYIVWSSIVVPILSSNTANIELAEAVTGLSWAISKAVDGQLPLNDSTTNGGTGEHTTFMSLYNAASTDELRTRCVGVLGSLGLAQGRIEINKEIGVFLISILSALPPTGKTTADPAIEALNAIFDVYADADFDYDEQVFVKHKFLDHLITIAPKVKAMTKKVDKRRFPELRNRADEALLNLRRFIEYKKKERS